MENTSTNAAGRSRSLVTFVSTGPGNADFLTQESIGHLREAERIYCFGTGQNDGTASSRTLETLRSLDATMVSRAVVVTLPMATQRTEAHAAYDRLANQLCDDVKRGQRVAVCVEGSSNIYASVRYVMERLTSLGIPYAETAGIPSFIAAATAARLSLCELQERLMVIPGTITADEIETLIGQHTNLVVMKLSHCTAAIQTCIHRHPDFQYHYFENIGTPQQFYTTDRQHLTSLVAFPYFSLMVIKPGR